MLKKLAILLTLILWPLNLILTRDFPGKPETIFTKDYQAEQLVLQNIHLYPDVFSARLFQNKGRIYFTKFAFNFFALTDPNYYFFASHPEPILPQSKNIYKFPFPAIIFFFYGIYTIQKFKYRKTLGAAFLIFLPLLSILKNLDGYDFILWLPVSVVVIHGIKMLSADHKKIFAAAAILFLIFAVPEILRAFI